MTALEAFVLLLAFAGAPAFAPLWGLPVAAVTMLSGAILGTFYLASGDLLAVILAPIATDLVGLLRRK